MLFASLELLLESTLVRPIADHLHHNDVEGPSGIIDELEHPATQVVVVSNFGDFSAWPYP